MKAESRQPRAESLASSRNSRGQSLLETILMMPLMLGIVLNAVNIGYFLFVTINLTGATRTAAEFAMVGPNSPGTTDYAPVCSSCSGVGPDVATLLYTDLTGAVGNATSASITICSPSVIVSGAGTTKGYANCVTCTKSTSCGSGTAGSSSSSDLDPESASAGYVLSRVQIKYQFKPLIPGSVFNLVLLNTAFSGGQYTFFRTIEMRAM